MINLTIYRTNTDSVNIKIKILTFKLKILLFWHNYNAKKLIYLNAPHTMIDVRLISPNCKREFPTNLVIIVFNATMKNLGYLIKKKTIRF